MVRLHKRDGLWATGLGSADDSAAIQLAVNAAAGRKIWFPSGTYLVGSPITGSVLWFECDDAVTFKSVRVELTGSIDPTVSTDVVGVGTAFLTELLVGDSILVSGLTRVVYSIADNTHLTVTEAFTDVVNDTSPERTSRFISDVEDVTLTGGTVGASDGAGGGYFVSYGLYWTTSIDNLKVHGTKFMCGGTTERAIACDEAVVLKRCDIRDCLFDDFVRSGVELPVDMTANDASANFDFLRADNVEDLTGTRRFVVIGSNTSQARNVTATRLTAKGLGGGSSGEVKGFLGYGVDINVSFCHFENVRNSGTGAGAVDAEAIYIKGANSTISHNYIRNGGHSPDGCITIKGEGFVDKDQWSDYSRITGNFVVFDDDDYDAPAIGVQRSYCIVDNNIMKDSRESESLTYDYAVGIGTQSSGVSFVKVHDNIAKGFVNFAGSNTVDHGGNPKPCFLTDNVEVDRNTATIRRNNASDNE